MRLLLLKHVRNWSYVVCIVIGQGLRRVGHQVLEFVGSSSAAEPTFALLECADRAQEVDLAERGPVDVCEI